ncbi:MAG: glycoside hydrolase family 2 protein [Lachnospiraceae bacterium]|nr:glycoside hydrolase family 2 protein [Lachnospiraceae bacterium]
MRRVEKLMNDWMFTAQSGEKRPVDLPHTWNALDGQDGGNNYYRGTCVYEKIFDRPDITKDEKVYIQFNGVNSKAKVILNDKEICVHENGYSIFRADITSVLKAGENNLRVEVDNSINEKIYPQMADFTFYGGIYRDVELLIVNKYHFDLEFYGGPGIKVDTEVNGNKASLKIHTYLNKADMDGADYRVRIRLKDSEGKVVGESNGEDAKIVLENPRLWDGIRDPYLYRAEAELIVEDKVTDAVSCNCGIRTFHFDSKKGFFLNGRPYPLRGVARHQDRKGIGNAITKEHMREDMELICEVGANTIRLAHYQHDQYFYDLCDAYGMVVWAEIPYISSHMPGGRENTFVQMRELIIQNYNHPSIVTWGISNEITISRKHKKDMLSNHHALQKLCKELDPGRVTTLACYAMCSPFHPVTKISDIVGWNLYLGWYVPGLFLNDLFIKFYHFIYPKRCLGYSEYGAEGMPNLHSSRPKRGDHTEEYQLKYHEYMLKCFKKHPFLWGTYVWNMFDFAADARNQGGEPGMNHKGLVTFDRKIKKDSFYLYKAWWGKEPFVHLCGKRYKYRAEKVTEIVVCSNQNEVSLYNNGKLLETKKGEHTFHFKIKLEKENNIEVRAGKLEDKAVVYKVDKARPEYKVGKSDSKNWM